MRRLLTLRIGGRYVLVPKTVGMFLILISLLMTFSSILDAVSSYDRIKDVQRCLESVPVADVGKDALATSTYLVCLSKAGIAGVYPFGDRIDDADFWSVMSKSSAYVLFWFLVLVISVFIYQTGKLFEVEEIEEKETVEESEEPKEEQKKTRRRRRKTK